jgi:hypothetical protein
MARAIKGKRRSSIGLEEIAPGRFLIHDPQAQNLLKGEGTISGRLFELTTWRREGLLARLRERGFKVQTLPDLVADLPTPPPPPPIGRPGWRPLSSAIEQISHFDLRNLRWHPLEPELHDGAPGVTIYDGWTLRRRKGRGAASFYLAARERGGGVGLRSLNETQAILIGYAQAIAHDDRPLVAERQGDLVVLPDIELPPPYRVVLRRLAREGDAGRLVDESGWPLARDLFTKLGLRLTIAE